MDEKSIKQEEEKDSLPLQPVSLAPVSPIVSDENTVVQEKESKWWTAAKIVGAIIVIPILLTIVFFVIYFINELGIFEPEYNIEVTKSKWEEVTNNLPEYFDFELVSEDASSGLIKLEFDGKQFDYICRNFAWSGWSKSVRCHYVFTDGETSDEYVYGFAGLLWHWHRDEVLDIIGIMPGIEVDNAEHIFNVENVDVLVRFFNELMSIRDYREYYNYVYEHYTGPERVCFESGYCATYDEKPAGKMYVRIGGIEGQNIDLLSWALENDARPITETK